MEKVDFKNVELLQTEPYYIISMPQSNSASIEVDVWHFDTKVNGDLIENSPEGEAVTKLIMAAPYLLEALQEFVDAVETNNGNKRAYELAQQAIEKAIGE